jgi:hypothetical protein
MSTNSKGMDRGWAWVVCAAAFVVNFCVGGLLNSFGVLYAGLVDYYSTLVSLNSSLPTNSTSVPSYAEGINVLIGTRHVSLISLTK